jgi:hypothetical protein
MNKLTLDPEKLTIDSFEAGLADQDCPGASAGATRTCPLDAANQGEQP